MLPSLFLPLIPLFFSTLVTAAFDCSFDITSHHFNLSPLKGVHTTSTTHPTPPTVENTTVFLDICQDLHWDTKLYDPKDRCEDGTQVCVIKYTERGDEKSIAQIIPAAGSFVDRPLEAKTSLLTTAGSEDVEGVVLEFKGQVYNDKRQRTVIELSCDQSVEVPRSLEANEVNWEIGSPRFRSFDEGVLRLGWRTKYACPSSADKAPQDDVDAPDTGGTKHWGFLTWLIIMYLSLLYSETYGSVFLVIAAYVIYSAFLNYSRYGAGSGWDLLPHSDTLRDMYSSLELCVLIVSPYLMRDFANHVISTLKGGSSRGGYSAV